MKAHDHAVGKKRLDRVAQNIATVLKAAGISSLKGKSCLEFGAGYAPSELIVFHLLGGVELTATDYNRIARLPSLATAAQRADRSRVLEALSPFSDPVEMERKLDRLVGDPAAARAEIERTVRYIAPFDMSLGAMPKQFDFIHSVSVLEHLPPLSVRPILKNLEGSLTPHGIMIHEIDLRDHRDLDKAPLAFLSRNDDYDPAHDFDLRGNRLRKPEWRAFFADLERTKTRELYETSVGPDKMPDDIIDTVRMFNSQDICATQIVLFSEIQAGEPV
jgi:SAM-dependent methyltransferase